MSYTYKYIFFYGGARDVIVENRYGVSHSVNSHVKIMNPIILPPAMDK